VIDDFEKDLTQLLNHYSHENFSNTPDFILAHYLTACLLAWNAACARREVWYGRPKLEPGTVSMLSGPQLPADKP
jgi:hypothetical protein